MDDQKSLLQEFTEDVSALGGSINAFLYKYSKANYNLLSPSSDRNDWICVIHNIVSSANIFLSSAILFEGLVNVDSLFGAVKIKNDMSKEDIAD